MEYEELGRLVSTASVDALMKENKGFKHFVMLSLGRYLNQDWGEMVKEDLKRNNEAVKSGEERIMASYSFPKNKSWDALGWFGREENAIWVITEWDHSVTTILFPSEY